MPPRGIFGTPLSRRPKPMPWAGFSLARFLSAVTSRESQQQNPAMERPWRALVLGTRRTLPISPIQATTVSLQKAHSFDRHHIANATAVLVSYLWIAPHMRFVLRSSKTLSPANAGPFCIGNFRPPPCSVHVDTTRHCPLFDGRLRSDHEIFRAIMA